MDELDSVTALRTETERFMRLLISCAGGDSMDESEYRARRFELVSDPRARPYLPAFVSDCLDVDDFKTMLRRRDDDAPYSARREYVKGEFKLILTRLESEVAVLKESGADIFVALRNHEELQDHWTKALRRRTTEPDGAITSARTLIESTCKHILDGCDVEWSSKDDLSKLFRLTAKQLNLAPDQHSEETIRQMLGGCETIVGRLAGLRNRLSDAHGSAPKSAKALTRHADLAVGLAGSMSAFLLATWEDQKSTLP